MLKLYCISAGMGGESSTIDLSVQLKDADGRAVESSEVIPLRLSLWCTLNGKLVNLLDEVTQATPRSKGGHRRGSQGFLTLSSKPSSKLYVEHDGKGTLSVRVTTTSKLNDNRKFVIEVSPDYSIASPLSTRLKAIFKGKTCSSGDQAISANGLSRPLEVMSKVNTPRKKRKRSDSCEQARTMLQKTLDNLQASSAKVRDAQAMHEIEGLCHKILSVVHNQKVWQDPHAEKRVKVVEEELDIGDEEAFEPPIDQLARVLEDCERRAPIPRPPERWDTAFEIAELLSRRSANFGRRSEAKILEWDCLE